MRPDWPRPPATCDRRSRERRSADVTTTIRSASSTTAKSIISTLMAELVTLGHRFRTRSDTEVIVRAWEEWGEACLDHFNGSSPSRYGMHRPRHCFWRATGSVRSRSITVFCPMAAAVCFRTQVADVQPGARSPARSPGDRGFFCLRLYSRSAIDLPRCRQAGAGALSRGPPR